VENNSSYRFNNKKRARSFLSEAPPHHHGESESCLLLDFPILPSYWFLLGLIIVYSIHPTQGFNCIIPPFHLIIY
jgi:hypothetical protein